MMVKKMNKTVIIYHKIDLDGEGSASIAREYLLNDKYTDKDIELYPINHGDNIEKCLNFINGKDVIMVDFSFIPDDMKKLIELSNYLIWIDHHITPIKEMDKLGLSKQIKGIRATEFAAIELTWNFFFPDNKMPKIINMLGIFDSWRNSNDKDLWEKFVEPVQYAINNMDTNPLTSTGRKNWSKIINASYFQQNNDYLDSLKKGKKLYKKKIKDIQERYKDKFIEKKVFGYNMIILETEERGSVLFKGNYFKNKHDIMSVYHKSKEDGKYHFSFYTDKKNIDLTTFARGHKRAAGMIYNNLSEIFKK